MLDAIKLMISKSPIRSNQRLLKFAKCVWVIAKQLLKRKVPGFKMFQKSEEKIDGFKGVALMGSFPQLFYGNKTINTQVFKVYGS